MKIQLLLDAPNSDLKGFVVIDSFADGKDNRNKGDVTNLDWACDTASVEELVADDILPYFPFPKTDEILRNWISKLAVNGKITLRGVDFEEVCRALILGQISIMEAQKLLWGEQDKQWNIKKSGFSILDIIGYLEQIGLKVTKKLFENHYFTVEAMRIQ